MNQTIFTEKIYNIISVRSTATGIILWIDYFGMSSHLDRFLHDLLKGMQVKDIRWYDSRIKNKWKKDNYK